MRYGSQYFHHTVSTLAVTVLNGIMFYALRVILYQNLTAEDYGLFYAVLSFSLVVQPFLSLGFDPGITPYITRFRERGDHEGIKNVALGALVPQGVVGVTLMVGVVSLAGPIAITCFNTGRAAALLRILVVFACLVLLFKMGQALLLGLQHIAARNLAELVRAATSLAAAMYLLRSGYGVEAAALAYTASGAAGLGITVGAIALLRPAVIRARFQWKPRLVAEVFRSGKFLSLAFGGVLIFSYMDTAMLTLVLGDYAAVAAYQVALPTMMIIYAIILAGASNFMPMATTLWHRGEKDLLADGTGRIYEAAAVLILPAGVLMACYSDVLMYTLFRRDILNAPDAFNVLAVGCVFLFTCCLNLHVLAGIGRERDAGLAVTWALGANVVLNIILIRLWGIRGAALATVLSHALATVLSLGSIRNELRVRIRPQCVAATVLLCCCIALACAWLRRTGLFATYPGLFTAGSGAGLYLLTVTTLEMIGCGRLRELVRIVLRGSPTYSPLFSSGD